MKFFIINDGNVFEGTPEQFAECFNPFKLSPDTEDEVVRQWCEQNGFTLLVLNEEEALKRAFLLGYTACREWDGNLDNIPKNPYFIANSFYNKWNEGWADRCDEVKHNR